MSDYRQLQTIVYDNVAARGYLDGKTPVDIVNDNFLKAIEETGEVARMLFDGHAPSEDELADMIIPIFVMAETMGINLPNAIIRKSTADIKRGVRG